MSQAPLLSVVFGTVDRPKCVKRLLDSMEKNSCLPRDVLVADAGDKECEADWPKNVTVVRESPRLGCVKGYNALFRKARTKYVCWLNDDIEVTPGWDALAVGFLEAHPKVGMAMLYWKDLHEPKWHWNKAYWDIPYANFGFIRRDLGERLGWFDEDLHMYGCDTSLSYKVWIDAKGVVGVRGARVLHYRHQDDHRQRNQATGQRDADHLYDKYLRFKARLIEVSQQFGHMQPSPEVDDWEAK